MRWFSDYLPSGLAGPFFITNNGKLNKVNDNSNICDSSFSGSKHFLLSGTNKKPYMNIRDVLCITFPACVCGHNHVPPFFASEVTIDAHFLSRKR